jgi:DNA-3-methyladenine glycosylase II
VKPDYWDDACRALSRGDPVMRKVIRRCGDAHLVARDDPFLTLARSIVGQQISVKAAQSIWGRVAAAAREVTPQRIARMRPATLQACGLSLRKVEYVRDLAVRFRSGEVDPTHWSQLDDEAVIAELVRVRGIGRWTAEMFLIFNLLRPDVFPVDDIGLLRAIALEYPGEFAAQGQDARPAGRLARAAAAAIAERWRPWRSVATWYLWRSLDPLPVEY